MKVVNRIRNGRFRQPATDFRHRRVIADDLAVLRQSSQAALHLVEDLLSVRGVPCTEEELSGVHYFGLRAPAVGRYASCQVQSSAPRQGWRKRFHSETQDGGRIVSCPVMLES